MVFEYQEVLAAKEEAKLEPAFSLNPSSYYKEVALIRLLSGTIDLYYAQDDITLQLRNDLSDAKGTENKKVSRNTVLQCIKPIKTDKFARYLEINRSSNSKVIDDLLFEFSYYFVYSAKGNHTSAFVHLYRILEFISYSFPLIHASSSRNYHGTFLSLQSYFSKDGGEFEFIKRFVSRIFEGDDILDYPFEFEVEASSSSIRETIYSEYRKILGSSGVESIICDDSRHSVSVKGRDVIQTIRYLRNRYFHFAIGSGQKNIRASEIMYPDLFFAQVNPIAANWLAIIYFELAINAADNWTK